MISYLYSSVAEKLFKYWPYSYFMSDYIYPDLADVFLRKPYTPLLGGYHSVIKVDLEGKSLVYKFFNEANSSILKNEFKRFFSDVESYLKKQYRHMQVNSFNKHVAYDSYDNNLTIEYLILSEWEKRGIPCMHILEKQDNVLVYDYHNSLNFKKIINTNYEPNFQYKQLLDTINIIRTTAKNENNPLLLHPDLLPQNFLYLLDENKTIAIDPGIVLNKLPFEELDARLNLGFIYHLASCRNKLNSSKYINSFLDTLNIDDNKLLYEFNKPLKSAPYLYFKIISELSFLIRRRGLDYIDIYSPKNTQYINNLFKKHLT